MEQKLSIVTSVFDATSLKSADSVFLAGGTEINRLGSHVTYRDLVSIKKIEELKVIRAEGEQIRIGACCTFTELIQSELIPAYLKEACHFMASMTKRNMATIGGNVALLRSDSYLVPTLIAAGARLDILARHRIRREICIETYLQEHEKYKDDLILAILLPAEVGVILSKRYANTAESHAVLTVSMGCDTKQNLSIGAAIKNAGIFDLSELAVAIEADPEITEEEILDWVYAWEEAPVKEDMFGSEKYKRYLLGVTISLMLEELRKGGAR